MTVVDYGPDVAALRRRLEAAEAEVARLRAVVDAARARLAIDLDEWLLQPAHDERAARYEAAENAERAALEALDAEVPRG